MPTVWVISDQQRTQAVYVEYVRHFANSWAVKHRYFALRDHGPALRRAVPGLGDELRSRGWAHGDLVLLVQDWEDDLLGEDTRSLREEGRRDIADRLVQELGGDPARVHVRLVPPTTEGLYLLLAHDGIPGVSKCLSDHVDPSRTAELERLIAKRGAFARAGAEPSSAPRKGEIADCLGMRHSGPKRRLAEAVGEALRATQPPPASAPCLRELQGWLTRFAV